MASQRPLTNEEGEVRELEREDFVRAVSFSALPESLQKTLRKRGAQKRPLTQKVSIRLSADVVAGLRARGRGWQTRVDGVLREWMARHPQDAERGKEQAAQVRQKTALRDARSKDPR
jgi:uncharacterized protein (DUF4415 family)